GIDQLKSEQHLPAVFCLAVELELDFDVAFGKRRGIHVDLDIDRGLLLLRAGRERLRRVGVLEGEILGVLRENIELRLRALPAVAGDGHGSSLTRDAEFPLSGGVANTAGAGGQWDAAGRFAAFPGSASGIRRHSCGWSSTIREVLPRASPRPRSSLAATRRCRPGMSSRIAATSVKNPGTSSRIPAVILKTAALPASVSAASPAAPG